MTAIKSSTGVSNKRLNIDIAAIRETIESGEISEVQWVQGKHQVGDVLSQESERKISKIIWRVGKYMMVKRC